MNRSKRIAKRVLGAILILLGIISGFIPFVQGWLFVLAGLYLLESEWVNAKVRVLTRRMKRR